MKYKGFLYPQIGHHNLVSPPLLNRSVNPKITIPIGQEKYNIFGHGVCLLDKMTPVSVEYNQVVCSALHTGRKKNPSPLGPSSIWQYSTSVIGLDRNDPLQQLCDLNQFIFSCRCFKWQYKFDEHGRVQPERDDEHELWSTSKKSKQDECYADKVFVLNLVCNLLQTILSKCDASCRPSPIHIHVLFLCPHRVAYSFRTVLCVHPNQYFPS